MISKRLEKISEYCWYVLIVLLPITSMPIVASLLGSDSVASPSIILLIGLVLLWLIPSVVSNKPMHRSILPLFLFVVVSIIGTLGSFFYDIPAFKVDIHILPLYHLQAAGVQDVKHLDLFFLRYSKLTICFLLLMALNEI